MARGPSSYNSYREWEAAQRAAERSEKKAEQERQKRARERAAAEMAAGMKRPQPKLLVSSAE